MAQMSPLLFPYGSARISRQARKILTDEENKQMLYQHTTGAWGHKAQYIAHDNLIYIECKAGTIKNGYVIKGNLFMIHTQLDVAPSFCDEDTPDYVVFDSDQERWSESSFPDHNLTFISLAEYHENLNYFSAPNPLGGYFLLLNDSNQ